MMYLPNGHPISEVRIDRRANAKDVRSFCQKIEAELGIRLIADPENLALPVHGFVNWGDGGVEVVLYEDAKLPNADQVADPLTGSPVIVARPGVAANADLHATTWQPHGLDGAKIARLRQIVLGVP